MIPDVAIMRHMGIGHKQVIITYDRTPSAMHRAPIDSAIFANDVPVTHFHPGGFAGIFSVLRHVAQRRELENMIVLANARGPLDHDMGLDPGARIDVHIRCNDGVGTHTHVGSKSGRIIDNGPFIYQSQKLLAVHIRSAVAATSSSTVARPENIQILRLTVLIDTSSCNWSPGSTGRLKRALSMPANI